MDAAAAREFLAASVKRYAADNPNLTAHQVEAWLEITVQADSDAGNAANALKAEALAEELRRIVKVEFATIDPWGEADV